MTMVERVARAIYDTEPHLNAGAPLSWDGLQGPLRELAIKAARAAIEAMHEPTGTMQLAGIESQSDCLRWSLEPGEGLDEFDPAPAWRAMIDAALRD